MPKIFHKLHSELLHLFQCLCVAGQEVLGRLNSIFNTWPDKNFVQGEKNTGYKGRQGLFQVNQHPTGFIGSAVDIISSAEPGV